MARVVLIAAGVAVLASPTWLWPGEISVFPFVSIAFTLIVAALVAAWGRPPPDQDRGFGVAAIVAAAAGAILIGLAAYRLVGAVLLNPPDPARGDMLTVIELAGRRFLRGRDPYATYQLPWQVSLPYGPPLWAPFLLPEMLRIDLRLLTASGQLFIPLCCAGIATLEAARARAVASATWLLLLAVIVFDPDLLRFVLVGHTPVYWPLLPLLLILMAGRHWNLAAAVLGVLVAARTTMAAVVPVFFMAVWLRDRSRALRAGSVWAAVVAAILLPFFLWDPAAMWRGMITNYVQGIKLIVWRSIDGGAIRTVGLTGWLLAHGLERFVELSQVCALAIVYFIAWKAVRRGASALPYMGLALFAFSMTTVWPVYYVHFDVIWLLASAALAETAGPLPWRTVRLAWPIALLCALGVVATTVRIVASPRPVLIAAQPESQHLLRQGFSRPEDDGARRFRWISGTHASVLLPRSSASAADLVVTGQPFAPTGSTPHAPTAVLNGMSLGTVNAIAGWQALRFNAPASAWRIGANELELHFPATRSLKELGLGDDPRALAMALERIDVQPR